MSEDVKTTPIFRPSYRHRMRLGLGITVVGFLLFVLGAAPQFYGMDRSPVIGFVQIAVFLIGLGFICLGGYVSLNALWKGEEKSILADIGLRLVATGYMITVATGMADVFGLGTQPLPGVPLFGPWQEVGVLIGIVVIGIGLLLMIPYRRPDANAPQHHDRKEDHITLENEESIYE
ncbi:MAG: hypothetical protein ACK2UW_07585 [Anaerolineales bacterium]